MMRHRSTAEELEEPDCRKERAPEVVPKCLSYLKRMLVWLWKPGLKWWQWMRGKEGVITGFVKKGEKVTSDFRLGNNNITG